MEVKTIYKNKSFELYSDKNGKFWLWDIKQEPNWAMREKNRKN